MEAQATSAAAAGTDAENAVDVDMGEGEEEQQEEEEDDAADFNLLPSSSGSGSSSDDDPPDQFCVSSSDNELEEIDEEDYDHDEFGVVAAITERRWNREQRRHEFKVHWQGESEDKYSWLPKASLEGKEAQNMAVQFNKNLRAQAAAASAAVASGSSASTASKTSTGKSAGKKKGRVSQSGSGPGASSSASSSSGGRTSARPRTAPESYKARPK